MHQLGNAPCSGTQDVGLAKGSAWWLSLEGCERRWDQVLFIKRGFPEVSIRGI